MKEVTARIRDLRKLRGKNQSEMADFLGLTRASYTLLETSKTEMTLGRLYKIADYLGTSVQQLLGLEKHSFLSDIKALPLIPVKVQAGFMPGLVDPEYYETLPKIYTSEFLDCDIAAEVEGDSMADNFFAGDKVGARHIESLLDISWYMPHIVLTNDGIVIKYIEKHKDKTKLWLVSENKKFFKPYEIEKEQVKSIWLVKGKISRSVSPDK